MTDKKELSIMDKLSQPLTKDDVEVRVGANTKNGFSLLLYKTARADVRRLNSVCGLMWKNEHFYDNKGLLCCKISVYDKETNQWITREDVGVESFTEKEKGSYSDSFKRAGFRFGIGIELYNSPFIFIKWDMEAEKNNSGKTIYKPKGFYSSNLEIKDFSVKDGAVDKVVITYNNKEIYPKKSETLSGSKVGEEKPKEKPKTEKKEASLQERYNTALKYIKECNDETVLKAMEQKVNILLVDLKEAKKEDAFNNLAKAYSEKQTDLQITINDEVIY